MAVITVGNFDGVHKDPTRLINPSSGNRKAAREEIYRRYF